MMRAKTCLVSCAALVATLALADSARASLAYSFENNIDGFFGLGAAVAAETDIGVTHGLTSMKYTAGAAGFVGARTETVIPADLNNRPGVLAVMFDLTITELDPGLTFADLGITIFGHDFDNGIFGVQSLFTDSVSITDLGIGQHLDLTIDLDSEFFSGESFNEIFGDELADLDVASAFQFHISKNVGPELTIYIDNVRLVTVPAPGAALLLAAPLFGVRRRRRR